MSEQKIFLIIACLLIALAIIDPRAGFLLHRLLGASDNSGNISSLAQENLKLKAEVARLTALGLSLPTSSLRFVRAEIYSRYPFAFKDEIFANIGESKDVKNGGAVIAQGMLVGKVIKTFENSSVVQTVFDVRTKIAVRVGKNGTQALFEGGPQPRLTLINKDVEILSGDIVYAADPVFPYGIPIAIVESASPSRDKLFQEANIAFVHNINSLSAVDFITNYVSPR